MYKPPFTITNEMLLRSMSITEKLGRITSFQSLKRMPTLRRNNKIKSIHSSLVIEANSLSLDQVRDVIAGKIVIGPQKEIQEVKNAYKAYEMINEFDEYSEADLLKAHGILTYLTVDESGKYRNHGEGVFSGEQVIFVAPSQDLVPGLMNNLFNWLKNDNETPMLLKSCLFHYEFVFIHPFSDGNGRTVRLWQSVLLTKWNPIFEYIPIETRIQKYQSEYYDKIAECHKNGNSDRFVEFMLRLIDETLDEVIVNVSRETKNISDQVNRLLDVMEPDIPLSANEIMNRLGIKSKETLRARYLNPAIENGLIKMTLPDKPNSKNQRYVK
ncbi:MAG TPA: Fic family protein [Bacilli bacterium]|jgi:Fic family protein|nr:Fic family protein [Acholeplasmataceae bacterium]HNZ77481.1 Fic family protein [Bacilli bacterium]HOD61809.1 Fic family protein [Bacilli bacterium]HOH61352.1 Fic family protein [Bacilli bacterium]HPM14959.1 Fic family protein [Bacilli bacterium]